jgi:hypothetical protein
MSKLGGLVKALTRLNWVEICWRVPWLVRFKKPFLNLLQIGGAAQQNKRYSVIIVIE